MGSRVVLLLAAVASTVVGVSGVTAAEVVSCKGGSVLCYGTANDDTITGTAKRNYIVARAGNDRVSGGAGDDEVRGGGGRDQIHGGLGNDLIIGGNGVDWLDGDTGEDEIYAGAGDDFVISVEPEDCLAGCVLPEPDFVDCGDGEEDHAYIDALDTAENCEEVQVVYERPPLPIPF
jgi:Ca2+-binding RTX toxin-like protein